MSEGDYLSEARLYRKHLFFAITRNDSGTYNRYRSARLSHRALKPYALVDKTLPLARRIAGF